MGMGNFEPNRFLRQLGTGHIYHWTPVLAKRKDMVEIDLQTATVRIESLKAALNARLAAAKDPAKIQEMREKMARLTSLSKELNALELEVAQSEKQAEEAAIKSISNEAPQPNTLGPDDIVPGQEGAPKTDNAEVIEDEKRTRILAQDSEYQRILSMKTRQELAEYLTMNYGEKIDSKAGTERLRSVALRKREERVFEVP